MALTAASPDCALVPPTAHLPGYCGWCGAALTGRRTSWCSDDCQHAWYREHHWNSAKAAALIRDDRTCRRCGVQATPILCGIDGEHWRCSLYDDLLWLSHLYRPTPEQVALRESVQQELRAHFAVGIAVEVDHIVPRNGRSDAGCVHHLANLQTLCHDCHRIASVVRRRIARALEQAARPALPSGPLPAVVWVHA